MCNLYSVTKGQSAIRDLFRVTNDRAGNLPPLPAVFPDQLAPINVDRRHRETAPPHRVSIPRQSDTGFLSAFTNLRTGEPCPHEKALAAGGHPIPELVEVVRKISLEVRNRLAVHPSRVAADGGRELVMARWGMPGPPQFGGAPVTNIRNVSSPHWRHWLGRGSRCVVPATSFCEYADTKPKKTPTWFALGEDRPLFAFAGLWTPWRGARGPKSAPVEGDHELFGFLTTKANGIVAPIHPKAMPVILTTPDEVDLWLAAGTAEALALQRPLPDEALRIVAKGEREDSTALPETSQKAATNGALS